jgi:hypothetical protein
MNDIVLVDNRADARECDVGEAPVLESLPEYVGVPECVEFAVPPVEFFDPQVQFRRVVPLRVAPEPGDVE